MESEVKEKLEVEKKGPVSMYLTGIPRKVHNKIIKYQSDLIGKHRKHFTLKEAYVELLKEASTQIK
jgi:hypothetical protein